MAFQGLPNIPDVPSTGSHEQDEFFRAVKETLDKMTGKNPDNTIDQRVYTEREIKIRTARDWPEIKFQYNGDHLPFATTNYYRVPLNVVDTNYAHTPPTWSDWSKWGNQQPASGIITIPEDGLYYVKWRVLFYHGAVATVLQEFLFYHDVRFGVPIIDPAPGTAGTTPAGWTHINNTYYDKQATATGYETHTQSMINSFSKGDAICLGFKSSVANVVNWMHGTWPEMHIKKIRECGFISDPGGPNSSNAKETYDTWIGSPHVRPDRQRRDDR